MLIATAGLMLAILIAALFLLFTRRTPRREGELLRIYEPRITAALGVALFVEAGIVLYFLLTQPERVASSYTGQVNACIFLLASTAFGAAAFLYSFVKVVIVFEDRVVYVSILGREKSLRWGEIDKIKLTQSRRLTLLDREGEGFAVGGAASAYREFVRFASKKIPAEAGEDILAGLRTSMKL